MTSTNPAPSPQRAQARPSNDEPSLRSLLGSDRLAEPAGAGAVPCRLCGGGRSKPTARLTGYAVHRCLECGFVYSDLPASAIPGLYDRQYFDDEFGPYFSSCFGKTDGSLLDQQFSVYAECLEAHVRPGRALDVGCAAGLFLEVLRRRGWRPEGVELSPYAAEAASRSGEIPIHHGDFADIELPERAFDAISMLDVLEHFADPVACLRRARQLLAPGGALLLVLPNHRNLTTMLAMAAYRASFGRLRYGAEGVHQIYHVSYFTRESLCNALAREGFEVLEVRPDETIQGLLNESLPVRLAIRLVFWLSRLLGLENKMIVVARPTSTEGDA